MTQAHCLVAIQYKVAMKYVHLALKRQAANN